MRLIVRLHPFQHRGWQGALPQIVQLVQQGISNTVRCDVEMDAR